jgi:APA family basic amino acid/polyamine antiporter
MSEEYKLINEQIGLWGGVGLLVGTAIGMSLFVIPTQMLVQAGPSVTIAMLISVIPMVFGVLGLLQVGGAIPVAGGIYVYGSRLVGPYWGMLAISLPVLAIWSYLLFAALGAAEYVGFFVETFSLVPTIPALAVMLVLLVGFTVLNYRGVRFVVQAQLAMVGLLLVGLLAFVVTGLLNVEIGNFTPMFPDGEGEPFAEGISPFLIAVVTLYIPLQGFGIIIEIGEELEDPVTNIPRVLGIGMAIVTLISVAVVLVLVGVIEFDAAQELLGAPEEADQSSGGLANVATTFTHTGVAVLIGFGALIGAATTINTLITSYSRTIMRAARDDVIPSAFAVLHERYNTPHRAILTLTVPPIVLSPVVLVVDPLVAVDALDWLVVVVVSGIFVAFAVLGVALWRLPTVFPQRYEHSLYRLPMPVLKVVAVGNIAISTIFGLLVAATQPTALALVLFWATMTYVVYRIRVRRYAAEGIDLKERMSSLHSHE